MSVPVWIYSPRGDVLPTAQLIGSYIDRWVFLNCGGVEMPKYDLVTEAGAIAYLQCLGNQLGAVIPVSGAPTLTSSSPASMVAADGGTGQAIGTNFIYGANITIDDGAGHSIDVSTGSNPTYTSATSYGYSIPPGALPAGTYSIKYTGTDGQIATGAGVLTLT